jgi:DNA-binding CsgD family transcriptional regulator
MDTLDRTASQGVSEFLRENYVVRDAAGFTAHMLSGLRRIVPTEFAAYCEMVPARKISVNTFDPEEPPAQRETEPRWPSVMHEHPVVQHYLRTRDRRAFKISDFVTEKEFHSRALYADFYRVMRIEDVMCFEIPSPAPFVLAVGLHRSRRNFTERERLVLNLVRPHLTQAWRNARKFSRLMEEMRALGKTLDALDHGVVVIGSNGRVRFATPQAVYYLDAYFSSAKRPVGHLPEELAHWVGRCEAMHDGDGVPPPRLPLVVERQGSRLSIRLVSEGSTRVLLLDEQLDCPPLERLRAFGLSTREAEVLAWVAHGRTNAGVASILGVSVLTIKKHLQHIFDKLGVETRTAATVRALGDSTIVHRHA